LKPNTAQNKIKKKRKRERERERERERRGGEGYIYSPISFSTNFDLS
jgi:predicted transcriptional regulator